MTERSKALKALLDARDITLRWLRTETCGEFAPTAEQFAIAAHVLREGWTQRALELGQQEPVNLDGSCKFASLFVKIAFGGVVEGAWEHQYNVVGGKRVDLSGQEEFSDVNHDEAFFGNEEHIDSLRRCLPRVLQWIFMLERRLFERNYPNVFRGNGLQTPRRDRDAEYRWAEKAQGTYSERYRTLHEALLGAGFSYDSRYAYFQIDCVKVWHQSAQLLIQRRVGLMKPLSNFTVRAQTTAHDTIHDRFDLTTGEMLGRILETVAMHSREVLETV